MKCGSRKFLGFASILVLLKTEKKCLCISEKKILDIYLAFCVSFLEFPFGACVCGVLLFLGFLATAFPAKNFRERANRQPPLATLFSKLLNHSRKIHSGSSLMHRMGKLLTDRKCTQYRQLKIGRREKGVLAKGVFAESSVTPKKTKTIQGHWAKQCIWHSERHSQERGTILQSPLLKTPFLGS